MVIPAYDKLTPLAREEAERFDKNIADVRNYMAQPGRTPNEIAESKVLLRSLIEKRPEAIIHVQKFTSEPDKTKGLSSVCPVHHKRMSAQRVPIVSSVMVERSWGPPSRLKSSQFPFADEFIGGACFGYSQFGKVFVCRDCQLAKKAWQDAHPLPK